MARGRGWHHLSANSVSEDLRDVAVYGPILDDLALFRDNGTYVSALKNYGADSVSTLINYAFKLSGHGPTGKPTLSALLGHIGADGSIDVWIDPESKLIRVMHFSGASYSSTTTINSYQAPIIIAPVL